MSTIGHQSAPSDPGAPRPTVPTPLLAVRAAGGVDAGSPQVVPLRVDGEPDDRATAGLDARLLDWIGATGKAGEVHPLPDGRWALGVGDGSADAHRAAGAALANALVGRAERAAGGRGTASDNGDAIGSDTDGELCLDVAGWSGEAVEALVTGLLLGSHRFRVSRDPRPAPPRVWLRAPDDELAGVTAATRLATAIAGAAALARDLASMPSDVKTPSWLAETAAGLAAGVPGLTAEVWPVERLAEEGFGGMLAVGGGSSRPPALLRLAWAPTGAPATGVHLVLVGKGVTFDTGGISIKPADGMHLMRTDMSGGAAVIGALLAIAELELPVRVTGLVPAAENHVSGSAYRPGDVVRHYDGTTTEVANTDAEGRMVLADAIGYAVANLEPDLVVDVATLTGAMKVALGMRTGGLFATDDDLAGRLLRAGQRVGERWWRMPLLEHVAEEVAGELADLRQTPPGPGGISAALFLRHFVGEVPWAHLDIAGPARCDKPYAEVAAGATGFAARTLVELARDYAARPDAGPAAG